MKYNFKLSFRPDEDVSDDADFWETLTPLDIEEVNHVNHVIRNIINDAFEKVEATGDPDIRVTELYHKLLEKIPPGTRLWEYIVIVSMMKFIRELLFEADLLIQDEHNNNNIDGDEFLGFLGSMGIGGDA